MEHIRQHLALSTGLWAMNNGLLQTKIRKSDFLHVVMEASLDTRKCNRQQPTHTKYWIVDSDWTANGQSDRPTNQTIDNRQRGNIH